MSLVLIASKTRVLRGGSFDVRAAVLRSANRSLNVPTYRNFSEVFVRRGLSAEPLYCFTPSPTGTTLFQPRRGGGE